MVKFEFLDEHAKNCGYSPTRCTNTNCTEVMNRYETEQHERELCRFRKIACDECGEQVISKSGRLHSRFVRKEIDDLTKRLDVVQSDMREVKQEVKQVKLTQDDGIPCKRSD